MRLAFVVVPIPIMYIIGIHNIAMMCGIQTIEVQNVYSMGYCYLFIGHSGGLTSDSTWTYFEWLADTAAYNKLSYIIQ